MAPKASSFIIGVLSITLLSTTTTISAFNITRLLDNHKDFSTFNGLLSQTGVAGAINSRRTITVLVVDNSGMEGLSGKPQATIKNVLATHVILDYFDETKLGDMKKSVQQPNLYQTTGTADKNQGYTNISKTGGEVVFGSGVKGAPRDSKMVKTIAAQPFNISVIQISQPINTPGLDQNAPVSPSSSPKASPPTHAPPPKKTAPTSAPTPAEGPSEDEGADAPDTEGPSGSPSPTPVPAPGPQEADADDEPAAKLASPPKSAGARVTVGGAIVLGLVALAL